MTFICALGAALANAGTSVLQRMGVEGAPASATLRLGLLTYALRQGVWLGGFALMIVAFALQATALHFGQLSEVQPILTIELCFLVVVLAIWFRYPARWREYLGSVAAAGGLAGFLIFANPRSGHESVSGGHWAVAAGVCGGGMVIAVVVAGRGSRGRRAAWFGTASAIGFAFTAALTKLVSDDFAADWLSIFRHPATYAMAGCGLVSVFLAQNAFHAGPIVASQSALVLVDPLASILIGIGLFGDNLRTAGAWGPLEALSLLVMFAGALSLAHSPLVSGIKGSDDQFSELLSQRRRREPAPEQRRPSPLRPS
jgi:drug/metabolite transporter (DMT)-like permease